MPAELLRITVPERRAHPGPTVTVAALLLPTTAEHPGNPIVFLMGGPGIPGTEMAPIPPYFTLFQRLRGLGDVLILDQRGIGRSEPNLDCSLRGSLPADMFVSTDELVTFLGEELAACAASWRERGVEPLSYDTLESADDVDDLRRALGVDRLDVLAFSYGTRLALAFVQRHGAHVGRVVLQGVNGPGLVVKRPGPVARKLRRMGELIAKDPAWHTEIDLLSSARSARERLAREPATVSVNDRRSGSTMKLPIGREGFDAIVWLNLDDARLPALLVSVAAGDDRLLTKFAETAWNGLGSGTAGLMARAVNCAADRPDARWKVVDEESALSPFGAPIDNAFLTAEFCRWIGQDTREPEFQQPVRASLPILLLTGELDATNPIENASEIAGGLENAAVIEIENAAHEALPVPAVQDIVVEFLGGSDVRGRQIAAPLQRFPTIEQALLDVPRRGR
jgi:pimeloyl-ACP methyl ester carboxylesterase